ncbi:MAG TPA: hemolysin family protein [Rhabdochlamydiaceae bacterium]|nr:hemolysin family protein [Rhabdochlamydiaceae bacterium]
MTYILVTVLIVFLFGIAFSAASETALFSLSPIKIKAYSHDPDPKKRLISRLVSRPQDLLITMIIINVTMSILIQNLMSTLFGDFSGWAFTVGLPLALILIFGEAIPKSVGFANNTAISYRVAKPLFVIQKIFLPFRKVLLAITNKIFRWMFFYLKKEGEISVAELEHALKTSEASGVLGPDEADLMQGYLKLEESTVKEFMRPREEVLYFDLNDPLTEIVHLFVDQECTRVPVCEGGLDKIKGIMTSGLFFINRDHIKTSGDLVRFLKKPFFIPESSSAKAILDEMYEKKESLAIAVDEYGSFSGLISLEDLVEAVVGEIADRRDEKSRFTRAGENVIIASGKLELLELESIFDLSIPSESHMVTVGGWLTEQLGDIPKTGTKYIWKNLLFHVLSSDQKRVKRIYIRKLKPQELTT